MFKFNRLKRNIVSLLMTFVLSFSMLTNVFAASPPPYNVEKTLHALWKVNSYTLTFNANGGSCSTASKSVEYGASYGTLPTPTRSNYKFDGWFTASDSGSQVSDSTKMGVNDVTVYAHWTPDVTLTIYGGNYSKIRVYSSSTAYKEYEHDVNGSYGNTYPVTPGQKVVLYGGRSSDASIHWMYDDIWTTSDSMDWMVAMGSQSEPCYFMIPSTATGAASLYMYNHQFGHDAYNYGQGTNGWVKSAECRPSIGESYTSPTLTIDDKDSLISYVTGGGYGNFQNIPVTPGGTIQITFKGKLHDYSTKRGAYSYSIDKKTVSIKVPSYASGPAKLTVVNASQGPRIQYSYGGYWNSVGWIDNVNCYPY